MGREQRHMERQLAHAQATVLAMLASSSTHDVPLGARLALVDAENAELRQLVRDYRVMSIGPIRPEDASIVMPKWKALAARADELLARRGVPDEASC